MGNTASPMDTEIEPVLQDVNEADSSDEEEEKSTKDSDSRDSEDEQEVTGLVQSLRTGSKNKITMFSEKDKNGPFSPHPEKRDVEGVIEIDSSLEEVSPRENLLLFEVNNTPFLFNKKTRQYFFIPNLYLGKFKPEQLQKITASALLGRFVILCRGVEQRIKRDAKLDRYIILSVVCPMDPRLGGGEILQINRPGAPNEISIDSEQSMALMTGTLMLKEDVVLANAGIFLKDLLQERKVENNTIYHVSSYENISNFSVSKRFEQLYSRISTPGFKGVYVVFFILCRDVHFTLLTFKMEKGRLDIFYFDSLGYPHNKQRHSSIEKEVEEYFSPKGIDVNHTYMINQVDQTDRYSCGYWIEKFIEFEFTGRMPIAPSNNTDIIQRIYFRNNLLDSYLTSINIK